MQAELFLGSRAVTSLVCLLGLLCCNCEEAFQNQLQQQKKKGEKNPLHVCLSIHPGKSHLVPSLAKPLCYQSQLVSPSLPG